MYFKNKKYRYILDLVIEVSSFIFNKKTKTLPFLTSSVNGQSNIFSMMCG